MKTLNERNHATPPDFSGDPQLALLVGAWEDLSAVAGYQVSLKEALWEMQDRDIATQEVLLAAAVWDETDAEVACD